MISENFQAFIRGGANIHIESVEEWDAALDLLEENGFQIGFRRDYWRKRVMEVTYIGMSGGGIQAGGSEWYGDVVEYKDIESRFFMSNVSFDEIPDVSLLLGGQPCSRKYAN